MDRRHLMTSLPALAAMAGYNSHLFAAGGAPDKSPMLPIFNPRQFGATGDGKTLDSAAVNAAITACTQNGGGMVYVSPGNYLCGTVVLKSNVTLYLEAGATILGSKNVKDYAPKHLIYAKDAENVTLAGPGKVDGQGPSYWVKKSHEPITEDRKWTAAIHEDWGFNERPSPMIELVNVTNLRISGIRIENAPGWTFRPYNCTNVAIQGVAIKNPVYGPNNDGMDITGCQNLMISDCIIDTGDDAICLKSEDDEKMPCRLTKNIVVTNCLITGCCNGFKIGTKTENGFENITFSNSILYNDDVDLPSRLNAGISLEMVDGGWVDGVVITGIQMRRVRSPLNIRLGNRARPHSYKQAGMRGILIDGIHASDAILTSSITGIPSAPLEDVHLANIHIDTVYPGKREWVQQPIPEVEAAYPQSRMFGWLPSSGFYFRHIKSLTLKNISFTAPADEWRPTILCDSVDRVELAGCQTTPIKDGAPPIELRDVAKAWITGAAAPAGSRALLTAKGPISNNILVSGCDVREANQVAEFGDGASPSIVQAEFNAGKPAKA
jgi:polygalacturonase